MIFFLINMYTTSVEYGVSLIVFLQ